MKGHGDWRRSRAHAGLAAPWRLVPKPTAATPDVRLRAQSRTSGRLLLETGLRLVPRIARIASSDPSFRDLLALKVSRPVKDLEKPQSHTATQDWPTRRRHGAGDTDGACAAVAEVVRIATFAEAIH